ncbi:MAG: hypothetical protein K6E38_05785 [Fretibacterium sp.]|nr:hypothetical protein [Fretibacterium sp.]
MRKFFTLFSCAVLGVLMAGAAAFADAKIPIVQYQCLVCDKYFYGFDGDPLDSEELNDPDVQLKRVFQLENRGKNLDPCRGDFKAHVFDRIAVSSRPVSEVVRNMSRIAVLKDGPKLRGVTISEWSCMAPDCLKSNMFTLNDDNLMITDWEQQTDKIFNLKGEKISKCKSRYIPGHAFWRNLSKKSSPVTSYEIAQRIYDIYYVKR